MKKQIFAITFFKFHIESNNFYKIALSLYSKNHKK